MNSRMVEQVYYVYRHIRLDTNEVFYVGFGTSYRIYTESYRQFYKRAFQTRGRSRFWENIFSQTEIRIEIIFESYDKEEVKQKEIEFISLYGRRDLGKGTLVNFTDGGDGSRIFVTSEETRQKIKNHWKENVHPLKGVSRTEEDKKKMSEGKIGKYRGKNNPLYGIPKTEEHKRKVSEANKEYYIRTEMKNHFFSKNYSGANNHNSKKVINIETGTEYDCITDAAKAEEIKISTLCSYLQGVRPNKTNLRLVNEQ